MTVKELINKLQKCSPDAVVCVEANCDPRANEVQEYLVEGGVRQVYIADELDYIDEAIKGVRADSANVSGKSACVCNTSFEQIGITDDGYVLTACVECGRVYTDNIRVR